MKQYYCPYCGHTQNTKCNPWEEPNQHRCKNCYSVGEFIECDHDEEYYFQKGIEIYGDLMQQYGKKGLAKKILIEEEVSHNPLFDAQKAELKNFENHQREVFKRMLNENNKNVPKCPTCNSTNISKISLTKRATHAYAFGLFSKTARSQFSCNNCGYKW